MRKLLLLWLIVFLLLPVFVLAQECPDCAEPGGLVPCGRRCNDPSTPINECNPCTLCHFFILADRIVDLSLAATTPVLIIVIIGLIIVTAYVRRGASETLQKAKRALTWVVIGLIILYASWVIVNSVFVALGVSRWSGFDEWWTIECPEAKTFELPGEQDTYCGDNIIQRPNTEGFPEVCDGISLDSETCVSQGFDKGTLRCREDCAGFNFSECIDIVFTPPSLPMPPPLDPIPLLPPLGSEDDPLCNLCGFGEEGSNLMGLCEEEACLVLGDCNWVPIKTIFGEIKGMCVYPDDCDYCGRPLFDNCLNVECRAIGPNCSYIFDDATIAEGGLCVNPQDNRCNLCATLPLGCFELQCNQLGLRCNFVPGPDPEGPGNCVFE